MPEMHVKYRMFFWGEHSIPAGLLIHDRRAQAAWYYVSLAHKNLLQFDMGATYEGDLDTPITLGNIMRGVAMMYGIDDPAEVEKFIPMCKQEAARCHYEWDARVEKPDPKPVKRTASTN